MVTKYQVFTGPCFVKQVADSFKRLPGVHPDTFAGTEHVYVYLFSGETPDTLQQQAQSNGETLCLTYIKDMKRIRAFDDLMRSQHQLADDYVRHLGR